MRNVSDREMAALRALRGAERWRKWVRVRRALMVLLLVVMGLGLGHLAWAAALPAPYRAAAVASMLVEADTWWDWFWRPWPRQRSHWVHAGSEA